MKRTSLIVDERLLAEATQILAAESYSAAVNTALKEVVRLRKIQSLARFGATWPRCGKIGRRASVVASDLSRPTAWAVSAGIIAADSPEPHLAC